MHTKRMNKLKHQWLNDLVYVHCNLHMMDERKIKSLDPIGHEHVDVVEDWIMHDDEDPPLLDDYGDDDFYIEQWGILEENVVNTQLEDADDVQPPKDEDQDDEIQPGFGW
uniref:Uncharacterized protein n=1 Tax=Nelumbo nucifera TaxID=4432 RepID=A0A822XSA3_NELNU|nr:TPA_asm: hypothetical protein HUJ06_023269 [Nelumbo nucifera]